MTVRVQRRMTWGRLAFLFACAPPVAYAVTGMNSFMRRAGAETGVDWTGMGLAAAMIAFVMLSLLAFSKGHRVSAGVLLFAAYAPLLLALFLMIVLRLS